MTDDGLLYAEDLSSGLRAELGTHTLSSREIVEFAREWDPLPIHTDERAAAEGPFGGLTASGVHTVAVATKMMSERFTTRTAVISGRGLRDLRLLGPVRPDVEITGTLEVVETELRQNGTAVTQWLVELTDPDGESLLTMTVEAGVRRR
jgi:acyl dehydratase